MDESKNRLISGRRAIIKLNDAMYHKLVKNNDKLHWKNSTTGHLVKRMLEEIEELTEALNSGTIEEIKYECADVGNFLMMIFDNEVLSKGG